jgi:hypothetical protein
MSISTPKSRWKTCAPPWAMPSLELYHSAICIDSAIFGKVLT